MRDFAGSAFSPCSSEYANERCSTDRTGGGAPHVGHHSTGPRGRPVRRAMATTAPRRRLVARGARAVASRGDPIDVGDEGARRRRLVGEGSCALRPHRCALVEHRRVRQRQCRVRGSTRTPSPHAVAHPAHHDSLEKERRAAPPRGAHVERLPSDHRHGSHPRPPTSGERHRQRDQPATDLCPDIDQADEPVRSARPQRHSDVAHTAARQRWRIVPRTTLPAADARRRPATADDAGRPSPSRLEGDACRLPVQRQQGGDRGQWSAGPHVRPRPSTRRSAAQRPPGTRLESHRVHHRRRARRPRLRVGHGGRTPPRDPPQPHLRDRVIQKRRLTPAVSSGGCNGLVEFLGWSLPCEGLAWASVEFTCDCVEVVLGELGEVGAFGEVLAEQSVGVLVGAALPG